MKTTIITRTAALVLAWTAVSGMASGQAFSTESLALSTNDAASSAVADMAATSTEVDASSRESVEQMSAWVASLETLRGDLVDNDGFIRTNDDVVLAFIFQPMEGESMLLRKYMVNMDVALNAVPETFYGELDTQVNALMSEIKRVAPTVSPITGTEADATVRGAISTRVIQGAPEAKVLRTVLNGDKWSVRHNALGLPKTEVRTGHVIYRIAGQELVVCQQIIVERPYFAADVEDYSVKLGYLRLQSQP